MHSRAELASHKLWQNTDLKNDITVMRPLRVAPVACLRHLNAPCYRDSQSNRNNDTNKHTGYTRVYGERPRCIILICRLTLPQAVKRAKAPTDLVTVGGTIIVYGSTVDSDAFAARRIHMPVQGPGRADVENRIQNS